MGPLVDQRQRPSTRFRRLHVRPRDRSGLHARGKRHRHRDLPERGKCTWCEALLPGYRDRRPRYELQYGKWERRSVELPAARLRGPVWAARTRIQRPVRARPCAQRQLGRHRERVRSAGEDGGHVRLGPPRHDDRVRGGQLCVDLSPGDHRHARDREGHRDRRRRIQPGRPRSEPERLGSTERPRSDARRAHQTDLGHDL